MLESPQVLELIKKRGRGNATTDREIAAALHVTERTVQNIRRGLTSSKYDERMWLHFSSTMALPWSEKANLQCLQMIDLIRGGRFEALNLGYAFSANQALEHILSRNQQGSNVWDENDWGNAMVAHYYLLGICFDNGQRSTRDERFGGWKKIAEPLKMRLENSQEDWAKALRIKIAMTPLLFEWQKLRGDGYRGTRNSRKMRNMVEECGYFELAKELYHVFRQYDRDTPFSALAIASRQKRREHYPFFAGWLLEAGVNHKEEKEYDDDFADFDKWNDRRN